MRGIVSHGTACLGLLLIVALSACRNDLASERAAEILRSAPPFTTRQKSPVRRELIKIVKVRPVGAHATEVEFTWKNVPSEDGAVKTGMALFRVDDDDKWSLRGLYKVE